MYNELYHYGTPKHSGRYPWGSGKRPYQGDNKINLSDKQKKYIKVGATIGGAVLLSYGSYKLASNPSIRGMVYKGMNHAQNIDFDSIIANSGPEIIRK